MNQDVRAGGWVGGPSAGLDPGPMTSMQPWLPEQEQGRKSRGQSTGSISQPQWAEGLRGRERPRETSTETETGGWGRENGRGMHWGTYGSGGMERNVGVYMTKIHCLHVCNYWRISKRHSIKINQERRLEEQETLSSRRGSVKISSH